MSYQNLKDYGTRVALLSCRHSVVFSNPFPSIGDVIMCRFCRKEVTIDSLTREYWVNCSHCRYKRPFGANKEGALLAMRGHYSRTMHKTRTYLGKELVEEINHQSEKIIDVVTNL